ncbi:MAG TPA: hypothetical protein PKE69_11955 [Pyrinomonadaceae bacterium]|nr:hypothetical protein [Pyrinomonadaceae bacterium]
MYHICYSNPKAWEISYKTGIYGNVTIERNIVPPAKQEEEDARYVRGLWGLFIDLTALKAGDKVFFYVKESQLLKGVFEVVDDSFFCQDDLFKDNNKSYPFRFYFREIKHYDKSIPASELASLIENGQLISISSFERDIQGSFRGIRQITNDEGLILEKIFSRLNPKSDSNKTLSYDYEEINDELEIIEVVNSLKDGETFSTPVRLNFSTLPVVAKNQKEYICQNENALKGFIFYCLRRGLNNVIEDIEVNNFTECLMEFPMMKAQQYSADILCIYRNEDNFPHYYSFIEIKRNSKIKRTHLSQLLHYMKTFSVSKKVLFKSVEGIYISNNFDDEAKKYLTERNEVEKEDTIRLIKYTVNNLGQVSFEQIAI